jgi:hypothetical protein
VVAAEEDGALRLPAFTAPDADPRRALFEAAVSNDLALLELHREAVSLEETFRKLTARPGEAHA